MGVIEEKVAQFIVETKDSELPAEAIRWAKIGSFDCLGVTLAGAASPPSKIITRFIRELGGKPETTVVGTGLRTNCTLGALANGTLAHALDYDDVAGDDGNGAWAHPSVILLPPLISVGERMGASGKDILDAYVIGYKVGQAVFDACYYYNDEEQGFHKTSIFGVLAATAACARLLKLDVKQTINAMGTAGSMGGGLDQNIGSYTKGLHAGLASQGGVTACLLAKDGWTGTNRLLESKIGFLACYAGKNMYRLKTILDALEKRPITFSLRIKGCPCCGGSHAVLDTLLLLLRTNDVRFEDIQRVTVDNFPYNSPVMLYPEPASAFEGKFSLHYTLAMAMIDKRLDVDSFTDEKMSRPQYREALNKLDVRAVLPWDIHYAPKTTENQVTIVMKDGSTFSKLTDKRHARGTPLNPFRDDEIQAKFKVNAGLVLSQKEAERACDLWWNIEQMGNIADGLKAVAGRPV